MKPIDWRELYASNRAVIERVNGTIRPGPPDERTYTFAGQTRRALVHPRAGVSSQTAVPLVCMLHGCTQDAATFAAATRMNDAADRHGFVVVYPQQERGDNAQGCWNWFMPEHQARGAGEPASIAAIVRELVGTASPWAIDPHRVFVAGLSAGGAMAAILAATPSAKGAPRTPRWATTPAPSRASSCTEAPTPGSRRSTQTKCSSSQ